MIVYCFWTCYDYSFGCQKPFLKEIFRKTAQPTRKLLEFLKKLRQSLKH